MRHILILIFAATFGIYSLHCGYCGNCTPPDLVLYNQLISQKEFQVSSQDLINLSRCWPSASLNQVALINPESNPAPLPSTGVGGDSSSTTPPSTIRGSNGPSFDLTCNLQSTPSILFTPTTYALSFCNRIILTGPWQTLYGDSLILQADNTVLVVNVHLSQNQIALSLADSPLNNQCSSTPPTFTEPSNTTAGGIVLETNPFQ